MHDFTLKDLNANDDVTVLLKRIVINFADERGDDVLGHDSPRELSRSTKKYIYVI